MLKEQAREAAAPATDEIAINDPAVRILKEVAPVHHQGPVASVAIYDPAVRILKDQHAVGIQGECARRNQRSGGQDPESRRRRRSHRLAR